MSLSPKSILRNAKAAVAAKSKSEKRSDESAQLNVYKINASRWPAKKKKISPENVMDDSIPPGPGINEISNISNGK